MQFVLAPDIKKHASVIVQKVDFPHLDIKRIVFFRSFGSKARAYARIWSLPSIWQKALQVRAHYCIEVLSEKFDKLDQENKTKVLIHEFMHIPKNFSGALLPHRGRGKVRIDRRTVEKLYEQFLMSSRTK
jgi:predicted metallopeptidase